MHEHSLNAIKYALCILFCIFAFMSSALSGNYHPSGAALLLAKRAEGVILFFVLFVALHQNKLCNINRLGIA